MIALIAAMVLPQLIGEDSKESPLDAPKRPPFKKHDHIQIQVLERSRANSTVDLRTDRRSRFEVEFDEWVRFDTPSGGGSPRLRSAALDDDPAIDIDARFRRDNGGRTSRNFDLAFQITAEVVDVRPNGNLVLQAKKRRKVNSDEEVILLTGEVSPQAIVNNAVRSENILNLDIRYEGSGPSSDTTKPGLLGKLLDILWPF